MTAVTITNPQGIYYGVYSDGGDYTQSDLSNPPTHFAVLAEPVTVAGKYDCEVFEGGDSYFSELYSIFNVTFTPETEGTINDTLYTELLLGVGRNKGDLDFPAKRFLLNQYRS